MQVIWSHMLVDCTSVGLGRIIPADASPAAPPPRPSTARASPRRSLARATLGAAIETSRRGRTPRPRASGRPSRWPSSRRPSSAENKTAGDDRGVSAAALAARPLAVGAGVSEGPAVVPSMSYTCHYRTERFEDTGCMALERSCSCRSTRASSRTGARGGAPRAPLLLRSSLPSRGSVSATAPP